jgi:hypothetical protein
LENGITFKQEIQKAMKETFTIVTAAGKNIEVEVLQGFLHPK